MTIPALKHDSACHCIACAADIPVPRWSADELARFNGAWDFARRGCAFAMLTADQLARAHGLRRVRDGRDTGTLIGYERASR